MNVRKLTTVLTAFAVLLALVEFGSSAIIWAEAYPDSLPAGAVVFGLLFLGAAWLLRASRTLGGSILLGLLCLFEVVEFPTWVRHSVLDSAYQGVSAFLSLVGLGLTIALLVARRRSPAATS